MAHKGAGNFARAGNPKGYNRMAKLERPDLPALLVEYQHIAAQAPAANADPADEELELELELRFEKVNYDTVETLIKKFLPRAAAGEFALEHTRTLNTLRSQETGARSRARERAPAASETQQVHELLFEPDGGRRHAYRRKTRMAPAVRIPGAPGSLGYRVILSQETQIPIFPVSDNIIFRAKNRLSFTCAAPAPHPLAGWRLDITIARELPGSASQSLRAVTEDLFALRNKRSAQRPETLLESLGLAGETTPTASRLAKQQQYKYEVEVEYRGRPGELTAAKVEAAANAVLREANPEFILTAQVQSELRSVAAYVYDAGLLQKFATGEWGLKQLSPPVIALTRGDYAAFYPPVGWYLTDKPNGLHALAVVRAGRAVVIAPGHAAGTMVEYYIQGVGRPTTADATAVAPPPARNIAKAMDLTILDGELIPAKAPAGQPLFVAFDVIAVRGTVVAARPFSERVQELDPATEALAQFLPAQPKPYIHLVQPNPAYLATQFEAMRDRDRPYESDGLVLCAPGGTYREADLRKWKPLNENSIDFLARRPPAAVLGKLPFIDRPGSKLFFLFVGISAAEHHRLNIPRCAGYAELFPAHDRMRGYFPIQFQPSDQPYAYLYHHPDGAPDIENRIIELGLPRAEVADGAGPTDPAPGWVLERVRSDRDEDLKQGRLFGNNFKTAEYIWINYRDPLTFDMLSAGPGPAYFATHKGGIYAAATTYMSNAKTRALEFIAGLGFVIDLGAGRGQDIGRYLMNRNAVVLMVDKDAAALAELVRRKHSWNLRTAAGVRPSTLFLVRRADFTDPYATTVASLRQFPAFPAKGADAVVCNLAAHYAFDSAAGMQNFVRLHKALLRPGGLAVFTLLDGEAVMAKFARDKVAPGQSWDVREDGVLKYSIKRLFPQQKLTPAGQKIGVLLPFSRGELYEEYLTNITALTAAFKREGFKLSDRRSVWNGGDSRQPGEKRALTEGDVEWLSMFVTLCYAAP